MQELFAVKTHAKDSGKIFYQCGMRTYAMVIEELSSLPDSQV